MLNILAIIPARSKSKRVPFKNIKNFYGVPIISYSINAAIKSNLFNEIMVSTDNIEIANIAKQYKANVPFLRSKKASSDFASTTDVILEVLKNYNKKNTYFDYFCCIYPTAPFITPQLLQEAFNQLISNKHTSLMPLVPFTKSPLRALTIKNKKVKIIWKKYFNKRTQDLLPCYYDPGLFYWGKTKAILKEKQLITNNCGYILLNEDQTHDIDTLDDWIKAEEKFAKLYTKNTFNNPISP